MYIPCCRETIYITKTEKNILGKEYDAPDISTRENGGYSPIPVIAGVVGGYQCLRGVAEVIEGLVISIFRDFSKGAIQVLDGIGNIFMGACKAVHIIVPCMILPLGVEAVVITTVVLWIITLPFICTTPLDSSGDDREMLKSKMSKLSHRVVLFENGSPKYGLNPVGYNLLDHDEWVRQLKKYGTCLS
jgi:hypothetical protein